jgi:hypothetical protein
VHAATSSLRPGPRAACLPGAPHRAPPQRNATLPRKPRARRPLPIGRFTVEKEPLPQPGGEQLFYVRGDAIERFAQMTNWDYYEAVKRCVLVCYACNTSVFSTEPAARVSKPQAGRGAALAWAQPGTRLARPPA